MLLLSRVPFIQEKHALEKSFAPIDPSYSYPEYEGKIFHIYSVLNELFSPTSGLEQAGSFGSKLPSKNLQMFWFSVMLGPDSFDSTNFQISKILCPPPECLVYGELPVSKHPQQKARKYIYICSQNTRFAGSYPPRLE